MYDVIIGGKRMTKRLTIALIALIALVLVAVLPVSATYYDINSTINKTGATVYIGEQQLNLTPLLTAGKLVNNGKTDDAIGWWASAAQLGLSAPTQQYNLTSLNVGSLYVSPGAFGAYPGNWYGVQAGVYDGGGAIFNAQVPSIAVDVWDENTATVVTGASAIQGDNLTFRVNTNLQSAIDPNTRINDVTPGAAQVGNIDIKVKSASGNTYTSLYVANTTQNSLITQPIAAQNVTLPLWFWGTPGGQVPVTFAANPVVFGNQFSWATGATDSSGNYAYPAGIYTVTAQSRVNGMYDNYLNGGASYAGATVSQPATVTIASNTVSISANVNSVVRSKPFSVTITGKPNAIYHLWIKGTNTMPGTYDNQPPFISANQAGVVMDNATNVTITPPTFEVFGNPVTDDGGYSSQLFPASFIYANVANTGTLAAGQVANALGNGTFLYANVTLDQTGSRTVQWTTTNWTKAQQYTIRVEQNFGTYAVPVYKYDEVQVQVQKGAVTIVAAGSQSYYLGEEVAFSGTDTESQTVYLFITGPNLAPNGANIAAPTPYLAGAACVDMNPATFQSVSVLGDNTWSWNWETSATTLDAGTYTIYAVSDPHTANNLANSAYGTVSIILKAPFVSATASQSTVAQGDPIYITGTAQGQPTAGVAIWILGKNYAFYGTQSVNSDASFSYELQGAVTQGLYTGQYFVVVQHPMENGIFDVWPSVALNGVGATALPLAANVPGPAWVFTSNPSNPAAPTNDFTVYGTGALQGANAAEALVEAINSPNVDDTYTKLQFLVETPVITVNPIGDHAVGDKFTVTGTTNLAVGDNVLFTIYSSSFQPVNKAASSGFSGASGTVQVTQGTNGLNAVSFDVDASTFKPDEYLVTAQSVGVPGPGATGTALFNVLSVAPTTVAPTTVATVATQAQTTVATQPPTQAPTATPTKTPGFGALVAVIGLGAVAFIIVRRH
jgi:PGF-CTERM protein